MGLLIATILFRGGNGRPALRREPEVAPLTRAFDGQQEEFVPNITPLCHNDLSDHITRMLQAASG